MKCDLPKTVLCERYELSKSVKTQYKVSNISVILTLDLGIGSVNM